MVEGIFERTKMIHLGSRVYEKDKKYYYRDTKHGGKGAHLEVFDKSGDYLGEADPITGVIREESQDPSKKLRKGLRQ